MAKRYVYIPKHNEREPIHHSMNAICLEYTDLSSAALIKIFQLADLLGITPKEAAKVYLAAKAKKALSEAGQSQPEGRAA